VSRTGSVLPARAWTSTVENDPGTIVTTIAAPAPIERPKIVDPMLRKLSLA
jgi:hypothetical protein